MRRRMMSSLALPIGSTAISSPTSSDDNHKMERVNDSNEAGNDHDDSFRQSLAVNSVLEHPKPESVVRQENEGVEEVGILPILLKNSGNVDLAVRWLESLVRNFGGGSFDDDTRDTEDGRSLLS